MMNNKINLREERDFGAKINVVFAFFKENFKPLCSALLFIAGPSALLAGIAMGFYQSQMLGSLKLISAEARSPMSIYASYFSLGYLLYALGLFLTFFLVSMVTYTYLQAYEEGEENITVANIWQRIKNCAGSVIGYWLLMIMFFLVLCIGIGIIVSVFQSEVILIGLMVAVSVLFFIYLFIRVSMGQISIVLEGQGPFEAFSRSMYLVKGKWWSTFGLLIIISLIVSMITMVFAIPNYIITFLSALGIKTLNHIVFFTIAGMLNTVGMALAYVLHYLAIGFQFFNLVEKKDGVGMLAQIETMGTEQNYTSNEGEF